MSALQIFSDSFRFYGRLFNKIFWLSVAYSLAPLLLGGGMAGAGQASGSLGLVFLGMMAMMLSICFFYSYQLILIHQFSEEQDDSLRAAFSKALDRTVPFFMSMMAMALFFMVIFVPIMVIGVSVLSPEGQNPEAMSQTTTLLFLLLMLPAAFAMYRLMFVPLYVIVKRAGIKEAFSASNQHIRKNGLVFRGMSLMGLLMLVYIILFVVLQKMIAVEPAALGFLQFALNIIVSPFFAIYLYRLFILSMPAAPVVAETNEENEDG